MDHFAGLDVSVKETSVCTLSACVIELKHSRNTAQKYANKGHNFRYD
jgi:hypothetical protein